MNLGTMAAGSFFFYLQAIVLFICIAVCLLAAAEKFRGWPVQRQRSLRDVLTALLGIASLAALATGRWTLAPVCLFMVLPMLRSILDPLRGQLTDEQRAAITAGMTKEDALRLLELDAEEATAAAIEAAYARLSALAASRKGGASPFYAARLAAARDFLVK